MGWQTNYPGMLTAPMTWEDIANALQVSTTPPLVVGTMIDVGVINKWSKVKPFEPIAADNSPIWNSAVERDAAAGRANFGLTPTFHNYNAMIYNDAYKTSTWTYTRPSTWWRTGQYSDLDGYIDNADDWGLGQDTPKVIYAPFGLTLQVPSTTLGNGDIITVTMFHDTIDFLVHLEDFDNPTYSLNEWYIGVLFIGRRNGYPNQYALYNTAVRPIDVPNQYNDYFFYKIVVDNNLIGPPYGVYLWDLVPVLVQSPDQPTVAQYTTASSGDLCTFDAHYLPDISKIEFSPNVFVTNTITSVITSGPHMGVHGVVNIVNRSGARITIGDLFIYIEAEYIVDWMPTYHQKIDDARNEWVNFPHTIYSNGVMGDGADYNKIIARYLALPYSQYVADGHNQSIEYVIPFTSDDLGNPYNMWTVGYTQIGYTPDGGSYQYRTY